VNINENNISWLFMSTSSIITSTQPMYIQTLPTSYSMTGSGDFSWQSLVVGFLFLITSAIYASLVMSWSNVLTKLYGMVGLNSYEGSLWKTIIMTLVGFGLTVGCVRLATWADHKISASSTNQKT